MDLVQTLPFFITHPSRGDRTEKKVPTLMAHFRGKKIVKGSSFSFLPFILFIVAAGAMHALALSGKYTFSS